MGRRRGRDPPYFELGESTTHTRYRRVPVRTPHDKFPDQVVVKLRNRVAGFVAPIPPNTEAVGNPAARLKFPERWKEPTTCWVLSINPYFDCVTALFDIILRK